MFYRQHFSWSLCSRQRPPCKEILCYFCHSPRPRGQVFGQYGDLPFWWLCSENAGGGERRALHWDPAWSDEPAGLKQNHCWLASFPCSSLCLQFGTGRGFFVSNHPQRVFSYCLTDLRNRNVVCFPTSLASSSPVFCLGEIQGIYDMWCLVWTIEYGSGVEF